MEKPANLENNLKSTEDLPERQLKKKIGGKPKETPDQVIAEKPKPKIVAIPRADAKNTVKIFDMLEQAGNYKQLKKGVNEVMKMLTKHKVEAVIMAADTDPLELLMNLPHMCEEHSVPYCFVDSTAALGRACGIQR